MKDNKKVDQAKKYAYKLLSYRGRSSEEIRQNLAKKYERKVVEEVIKNLRQLKYLDDKKFAEELMQKRARDGKGGKWGGGIAAQQQCGAAGEAANLLL